MKEEISDQQALIELYEASTLANLTKKQHEFLLECAKQIEIALMSKPVEETPEKK